MIHITKRTLSIIVILLTLTVSVFSDVLVYDGVPTTGTGAYTGNAKLVDQNPTHASIVGEIDAWKISGQAL